MSSKKWFSSALFAGILLALGGCSQSHRTGGGGTDRDGDGYEAGPDCNDDDPAVHPGADEMCGFSCDSPDGDGRDNDCDGVVDDGCGPVTNCFWDGGPLPVDEDRDGYPAGADCNDADPAIHPGAEDLCCDMIDSDCDGATDPVGWECNCFLDPDVDADGYPQSVDCDDNNYYTHPGATELCFDGVDQDCDGAIDEEPCAVINGMADAIDWTRRPA